MKYHKMMLDDNLLNAFALIIFICTKKLFLKTDVENSAKMSDDDTILLEAA